MTDMTKTGGAVASRRTFLKSSALAATPAIVLAPSTAFAGDDSRRRLAQLEDERAIEQLRRDFLRRFNSGGLDGVNAWLPEAVAFSPCTGLRSITVSDKGEDEARARIAADSACADARCRCELIVETEYSGSTTLEKMARAQGNARTRHTEKRDLRMTFSKGGKGWEIASVAIA